MACEASPHPFTAYNKPPKDALTLVGNWVEERSLKETTGCSRYEPWVLGEAPQEGTSIYATRHDKIATFDTHPRVVEHLSQVAPANWRSMYGASYRPPAMDADLIEYKSPSALGPRAKLELEAMKAVAADLPPDVQTSVTCQGHETDMSTTYRADFVDKDLTANRLGARCMRDHDGRPAVRDPTFLAETQLVARPQGDRLFGESARRAGALQTTVLPNPDVPVTIYSEAVATRKYGGNIAGTRPIAGTLPFNKFTNFSKPLSEYNKVVVDE